MTDLSLEDLCIHEGLDYKQTSGAKGEQLNLRCCPNVRCGSEKWKVYANADTSAGNCFSCGQTYNLWTFVGHLMESRGGTYPKPFEIGRYLDQVRKKMGYRPKARVSTKPVVETRQGFELPQSAPLPYEDGWVHPYLLERGINAHYAKLFDLRYSAFGRWVYKNANGDDVSQNFSERIIIPVYDLDGELVNFQGRDVTGFSDNKYIFAGGLPATGRYLYNGHVAKARKAKRAVMGEGAIDIIGIQKALDTATEWEDAVPIGSWGKHLTKSKEGADQVGAFQELRRLGLEQVYVLYDPEPEAYEEAIKAAELLTKIGLRAFVALLPAGCDPGDADAQTILDALSTAKEYTRMSALRMRMVNPYR